MELKTARRIGGGLSVQTLLFVVAFFELYALIQETRGDFANGILFFFQEQLSPFDIGALAILFTATYFFGRAAGKEILVKGRSFAWVGLKYSLLTFGIFSAFIISIYAAANAPHSAWNSLLFVLLRIIIMLIVVWIWSGWRINRKK